MSDTPAVFRRTPYGANPAVGERARKTYERILRSSMRAFERYGFDEANIDDIATNARMSRATVYQYFDSKQAILAALSQALGDEIIRTVDDLRPVTGDDDGRAELRNWVVALDQLLRAYAAVIDVWTGTSSDAPADESSDAFMHRFTKHLASKFAAADDFVVDPLGAAVTIFAVLQGTSDTLRDAEHDDDREAEILREVADILHDGLFA